MLYDLNSKMLYADYISIKLGKNKMPKQFTQKKRNTIKLKKKIGQNKSSKLKFAADRKEGREEKRA